MGYLVSRPDLLEDNVRPCFKKKSKLKNKQTKSNQPINEQK